MVSSDVRASSAVGECLKVLSCAIRWLARDTISTAVGTKQRNPAFYLDRRYCQVRDIERENAFILVPTIVLRPMPA